MVDVDDHERLNQALNTAQGNDVELVVSNPCFEIWLLYHFQPYVSSVDRGTRGREKMRKHIPQYKKNLPPDFPFARHPEAAKRALSAAPGHNRTCVKGPNPSTNAWLLVQSIEAAGARSSTQR